MSYERCIACGSSRLSPPTSVTSEGTYSPSAKFKLKNPPKGLLARGTQWITLDRVCICADCGYAAFFTTDKFEPGTLLPFG